MQPPHLPLPPSGGEEYKYTAAPPPPSPKDRGTRRGRGGRWWRGSSRRRMVGAACPDRRSRRCAGARRGPERAPPCAAPRATQSDWATIAPSARKLGTVHRRDLERRGRLESRSARRAAHAGRGGRRRSASLGTARASAAPAGRDWPRKPRTPSRRATAAENPRACPGSGLKARGPIMKSRPTPGPRQCAWGSPR